MQKLSSMVDMATSSSGPHVTEDLMSKPEAPRYPYGLSIRLGQPELDKLNVDHDDWAVGDHFHLNAMAKITSISAHEHEGGKNCCVELQIVALGADEDSDEG